MVDVLSIDEHNILKVVSYNPDNKEETISEASIVYSALK